MYDLNDLDFIFEHFEDINLLNELYVGETEFIDKLISAVSKARAPYVGKVKRPIKGNKDFIEIGDMIAKEFGFYAVTFTVPFDTSMNAFTYPITMNIDKSVIGVKPKFFKDKGLKYDESVGKLCILVAVTAGVWFSPEITDREVVAAILHEVGHSFVTQSKNMIDIIEANREGIAISLIMKYLMDFYMIITNTGWAKTLFLYSSEQDIETTIKVSNKGKEIMNEIARELANNPLFFGFKGIAAITEWLKGLVTGIAKEFTTLISGAINIAVVPFMWLNSLLSNPNDPNTAFSRSQEYLSDSFAAMYGMGPEISSFLVKIGFSASSSGSHIEKIISKIPVVGALHETLKIPTLLLSYQFTTHPSTPARINKILDELNKELNNSDLSPKTKEAVKKNIKELEKIKADLLVQPQKKKYNAEEVKRMWMAFLVNKNEKVTKLEKKYTDLKMRDDYVKKESTDYNIEII